MINSWGSHCEFYNIGQQFGGDRTEAVSNYTDKHVYLLDWSGSEWLTLAQYPPSTHGDMAVGMRNRADAVQVCA